MAGKKQKSKKDEAKKPAKSKKTKKKTFKDKKNIVLAVFVAIILVGVVVLANIFWPVRVVEIPVYQNETVSEVVALVNGEEITSDELNLVLEQSVEMYGPEITREEILENLIIQKLLIQKSIEEGFFPTVEEVEEELLSWLAEQGSNLEEYKEDLMAFGYDYDEHILEHQRGIAIQNYFEFFLEGKDFEVTEEEIRELYSFYEQQGWDDLPPYEEIKEELRLSLEYEKQDVFIEALINQLKEEADIQII